MFVTRTNDLFGVVSRPFITRRAKRGKKKRVSQRQIVVAVGCWWCKQMVTVAAFPPRQPPLRTHTSPKRLLFLSTWIAIGKWTAFAYETIKFSITLLRTVAFNGELMRIAFPAVWYSLLLERWQYFLVVNTIFSMDGRSRGRRCSKCFAAEKKCWLKMQKMASTRCINCLIKFAENGLRAWVLTNNHHASIVRREIPLTSSRKISISILVFPSTRIETVKFM